MCAKHMSRRDLNTLIDAALTTCTGSLFNSHREEFVFKISFLPKYRVSNNYDYIVKWCSGI